ncbi:solute carrier family 25 member 3a isoform X2 [Betta splendens]|uniref:Solute carrier family 25 member 3 n=1 Tax=Betta splendens TaxID=158456 RepID=A0A6P7NDS3_BETSP|nr:solute carrier family 25 member 3a isoform X2 [Betta splendens]
MKGQIDVPRGHSVSPNSRQWKRGAAISSHRRSSARRHYAAMYPTSLTQLARANPFSAPLFSLHEAKEPAQSVHGQTTRRLAAAAAADESVSCEFGSSKYYALCGFGGILSCGITHTAVVPLDLVKCRLQVNPDKYKSIGNGFSVTIREDGVRGLAKGWAPTFIGYSMQGLCKFGFYEVFKIFYSDLLGEENSYMWRTSLYLAASASAEFFADIALAPMEAVKVRIQTQPGYANTLRQGVPKMYAEEGLWAFYKGVVPLWMRQIPYTMMKFACFERTVEMLYKYVVPKPRSECSKPEQLVVTFVAGYIAGVFCAIVSHPADSVVSVLNKEKGSTALQVLKRLGPKGVWKGLIARIIMIGTLTALQWFIYDSVKVYFRLPRPPPPEMPESLKKKLGLTE